MFFYQTTKVSVNTNSKDSFFDPLKCDATRVFLDHYSNKLFLVFMSDNGTIAEKRQAFEELEICERKMKYWKRQPHFIETKADSGIAKLNKGMSHA